MRGQTADPAERSQCTCALRERRLGDVRSGRTGTGVLLGRHESMVAKTARQIEQSVGRLLVPVYSITGGRRTQIADQCATLPREDSRMRSRVFVFSAIVMLASLTAANATDLNGQWKGDMKTPNGDILEINFNFQVSGEKLTGTVTNTYGEEQITEGTVKGDAISFVILAGGGQFKITYKGKVVGEDLKFNVTIADMGEGELTAKRVK